MHFGFNLGTNFMNFRSVASGIPDADGNMWYAELPTLNPGFHVGVTGDFKLNNYFALRLNPGISFGQRDIAFVNSAGTRRAKDIAVKSTFIDMPLLLKYRAVRDGNARMYLLGGVNGSLDLARSKKDDLILNPWDYYLEFGVGSDFYLMYFRFGVELKYSLGMTDVLYHDRPLTDNFDPRYMKSVKSLKSQIITISFNFE